VGPTALFKVGAADWGLVRVNARDRVYGPQPTFLIADPAALRASNRVATLEVAKAEFEESWKLWKAWAKMDEVP
jgi:hypothetical protein